MAKVRVFLIGARNYLIACPSVYCQTLTPDEKMQWFTQRIFIWLILGFIVGTVASFAWVRRVKYVPENLSIDGKVRGRFVIALIVSAIAFCAGVWLDLWLIYNFETFLQGPFEALSETLRSWETFSLVGLATSTFYAASLIWTRGAFSGRYALWFGPKRQ